MQSGTAFQWTIIVQAWTLLRSTISARTRMFLLSYFLPSMRPSGVMWRSTWIQRKRQMILKIYSVVPTTNVRKSLRPNT
ncbi:hypothetical protein B0H17DRAFT_1061764 [Mycena rosella]|uniref:Secreted protein n=1 Tax=Mycena rosella TaxID=1033263 RepID=A0AAD7GI66_MYCRO|nr:hypothetical protein B0H17DRAFT_1061764 [Mycena rosella]